MLNIGYWASVTTFHGVYPAFNLTTCAPRIPLHIIVPVTV